MTALNLSVSQRRVNSFSATLENGTMSVGGEYEFKVSNDGLIPIGKINIRIDDVSISEPEALLISDENKSIGRLSPLSTQTVTVEFNEEFEDSEVIEQARSICENKTIPLSTSSLLRGRVFNVNASSSGEYNVLSLDCDLTPTSPSLPEPEPSPGQPSQPPDSGQGQQENDRLSGPSVITVNTTEQYVWSDFDDSTVTFNWALLSERSNPNPDATELALADEEISNELTLSLTSQVQGDFLIVIEAYNANQELADSVQKVVSVVAQ
jgi:hypothetical protein